MVAIKSIKASHAHEEKNQPSHANVIASGSDQGATFRTVGPLPDTSSSQLVSSLPAKLPYTAKMYPYNLEPPLIAQAYHNLFHALSLMLQCPIPAFQLAYKLALNLQASSSPGSDRPPCSCASYSRCSHLSAVVGLQSPLAGHHVGTTWL